MRCCPSARTATWCASCAGCLTIQGLETYLLQPRDPADIDMLIDAIRPAPAPNDIDVVIGMRGPIAPPEMCNGLDGAHCRYSTRSTHSRRDALIKAIPRPEKRRRKSNSPRQPRNCSTASCK